MPVHHQKRKRRKLSPDTKPAPYDETDHEPPKDFPTPTASSIPYPRDDTIASTPSEPRHDEWTQQLSNNDGNTHEGEKDTPTTIESHTSKSRGHRRASDHRTPAATKGGLLQPKDLHTKTARLCELTDNGFARQKPHIESWLRKLKSVIEEIPEREPIIIDQAAQGLLDAHNVRIPFSPPKAQLHAHCKLGYIKPAMVNVVGSYALGILPPMDQALVLDVAVIMPRTLFSEKDYLDYRYLHKRAFYLAYIAAHLKDSMRDAKIKAKYTYLHDNPLLPALLVEFPSTNNGSDATSPSFSVRILPTTHEDVFPIRKTSPMGNCVRGIGTDCATPFYNATIRSDISIISYLKLLHHTTRKYPCFKHGCYLGRVWLQQRGLGSTPNGGGFGNFEWMVVMAILFQTAGSTTKPLLLPTFDGLQLFRMVLQFLARRDLTADPFYTIQSAPLDVSEDPMFFDGKQGLNLLYKMTSVSYCALRHEAQLSLKTLNSKDCDHFGALFGIQIDVPLLQYDIFAYIPISPPPGKQTLVQHKPFFLDKAAQIHSCLTQGLGNRIDKLVVQWPEAESWSITSTPVSTSQTCRFVVKLALNMHNAARILDKGPMVEHSSDSTTFKELWGEKTELRRFKNGTMHHSVLWSAKEPVSLIEEICRWLIDRHIGHDTAKLSYFQFMSLSHILPWAEDEYRTTSDQIQLAYKDLEETLRGLKALPLEIRSFQPSCSILSSTSLRIPGLDAQCLPADVNIQFESSGHWPDDFRAIQMTKAALLLKLADLLVSTNIPSKDRLACRVGLENSHSNVMNRSFLDVTYATGVTFRIRIHCDREVLLLERQAKDTSRNPSMRELSTAALASCRQLFIKRPLHTQAMAKAVGQFPALSGTVRLLKAWISSQLLSNHVQDELLELLSAKVFIHPEPWTRPATSTLGFFRVIWFLSSWDWLHDPLVVDFASISGPGMTHKIRSQIRAGLEALRAADPLCNRLSMMAATNFDVDGTTWTTSARPNRLIASRIVALARSAFDLISKAELNHDLETLFVPNLRDFDFLLRISPKAIKQRTNPKSIGKAKKQFRNLETAASKRPELEESLLILDTFIGEVNDVYGDAIVLFSSGDNPQTSIIPGIWNPGTVKGHWKPNLGFNSVPVGPRAHDGVRLDKAAILNEISRVGDCVISYIEGHTATTADAQPKDEK